VVKTNYSGHWRKVIQPPFHWFELELCVLLVTYFC